MKDDVENLYYMTFDELALSMDSQVDGVHATDLGMQQYADAYYKKISSILFPEQAGLSFVPSRQHRDSFTYQWTKRHDEILDYNAAVQPQIVMLGNSITHFWGGMPCEQHRVADDVWQKLFKGKSVVNLGFGWDRIENVQWRVLHGELDGFCAQKIFMMLGTNNLYCNTDEEIIRGIKETVHLIAKKQPQAQLYVIKILPRRDCEARLVALNRALEQAFEGNSSVQVLDLTDIFMGSDGKINEKLFSDGLHPNRNGYKQIADILKAYVK